MPEVAVRHLRAMYNVDIKEIATQLRCPTLALHVKGDQIVPFNKGRRLAALIPGARLVPLEGNKTLSRSHPAITTSSPGCTPSRVRPQRPSRCRR